MICLQWSFFPPDSVDVVNLLCCGKCWDKYFFQASQERVPALGWILTPSPGLPPSPGGPGGPGSPCQRRATWLIPKQAGNTNLPHASKHEAVAFPTAEAWDEALAAKAPLPGSQRVRAVHALLSLQRAPTERVKHQSWVSKQKTHLPQKHPPWRTLGAVVLESEVKTKAVIVVDHEGSNRQSLVLTLVQHHN